MKSRILNILLFISFIVTLLVPITGVIVHKMASVIFLLLCMIHTIVYRKKLDWKKYAALGIIIICFLTGIFGMIYVEIPLVMALHKIISIGSVFILAIHIYIFRYKMIGKRRKIPQCSK